MALQPQTSRALARISLGGGAVCVLWYSVAMALDASRRPLGVLANAFGVIWAASLAGFVCGALVIVLGGAHKTGWTKLFAVLGVVVNGIFLALLSMLGAIGLSGWH